jgi:hypothetical protein
MKFAHSDFFCEQFGLDTASDASNARARVGAVKIIDADSIWSTSGNRRHRCR